MSGNPLAQTKFLGAPFMEDSASESQQHAVRALLDEWGVYRQVIGMVFYTTPSNTGKWKGAAALLEK